MSVAEPRSPSRSLTRCGSRRRSLSGSSGRASRCPTTGSTRFPVVLRRSRSITHWTSVLPGAERLDRPHARRATQRHLWRRVNLGSDAKRDLDDGAGDPVCAWTCDEHVGSTREFFARQPSREPERVPAGLAVQCEAAAQRDDPRAPRLLAVLSGRGSAQWTNAPRFVVRPGSSRSTVNRTVAAPVRM